MDSRWTVKHTLTTKYWTFQLQLQCHDTCKNHNVGVETTVEGLYYYKNMGEISGGYAEWRW